MWLAPLKEWSHYVHLVLECSWERRILFLIVYLIPQEWLPERYEMGFNLMHSGKFGAEFLA